MVVPVFGNNLANELTANFGGSSVFGLAGNDILYGSSGNDSDRLFGGSGNDTIYSSSGQDFLYGGSGNDTYILGRYASYGGSYTISERVGEGTDTIIYEGNWINISIPANVERMVIADSSQFVYGNAVGNVIDGRQMSDYSSFVSGGGDDVIYGTAYDDLVNGGTGADTMVGGNGWDSYTVDNAGDKVIETAAAGGYDNVLSLVNYVMPVGVESVTLTGLARIATGSVRSDVISGSGLGNTLTGGAGFDSLIGSGGNDRLDGGTGNDLIDGGSGLDTMLGGLNSDTFTFQAEYDTGRTRATADVIVGLDATDWIDLSSIDANAVAAEHQRWSNVGAAAFTGVAGQLHYAGGYLEGDRDGNRVGDFFIKLNAATATVLGDLIL